MAMAWSPMSMESHWEWLRAPLAVGPTWVQARSRGGSGSGHRGQGTGVRVSRAAGGRV